MLEYLEYLEYSVKPPKAVIPRMEYTVPPFPQPPPAPKKGYVQYYSAREQKWVFVKR